MFVLNVSENGYITMTDIDDCHEQTRGGRGMIMMKTSDRNGKLAGTTIANSVNDKVLITTVNGMGILFYASDLKVTGRSCQGVCGIKLAEGDKVVNICVMYED